MKRAFPKSLEKTIGSKCWKKCCGNVIVLKVMCPACYKGCKCQGTAPACTSAVHMETSDEKEI